MVDVDLVRNKISSMKNNLNRLREKSCLSLEQLKNDQDTQDIVLHNLQLAIQACIDIGSHIIADESWEIPGSLGGIFLTLQQHNVISAETTETLRLMAGFRNILIHEYEKISLEKVHDILTKHINDFDGFLNEIVTYCNI